MLVIIIALAVVAIIVYNVYKPEQPLADMSGDWLMYVPNGESRTYNLVAAGINKYTDSGLDFKFSQVTKDQVIYHQVTIKTPAESLIGTWTHDSFIFNNGMSMHRSSGPKLRWVHISLPDFVIEAMPFGREHLWVESISAPNWTDDERRQGSCGIELSGNTMLFNTQTLQSNRRNCGMTLVEYSMNRIVIESSTRGRMEFLWKYHAG